MTSPTNLPPNARPNSPANSPKASGKSLALGIFAAAALFVGIAVGTYYLQPQPEMNLASATLLPTPRPVIPFTLTDEHGQPFTREQLSGHWTLIFAGYTHCPDVCPTTLQMLKAVKTGLGADSAKLKILFLSVDPERDTPASLDQYVHFFGADFDGITAQNADEIATLDKLSKNLGFIYLKVPGPTPESYTMDHSAALMLINPQAELAGYLSPPFDIATIVQDFMHVLKTPAH